MELSNWKKVSIGVFGTVFLGALGAGMWEVALKPSGIWLGKIVLTAATFGSSSIKNEIYREAAKGVHEASSLQSLSLLILCISSSMILFSRYMISNNQKEKRHQKYEQTLHGLTHEERILITKKKIAAISRILNRLTIIFIGLTISFASVNLISFLELDQANAAHTFFAQSMEICRPYLSDQEAHLLQSRFAEINGRDDYISVTNDLRRIADTNHRKLPEFSPW